MADEGLVCGVLSLRQVPVGERLSQWRRSEGCRLASVPTLGRARGGWASSSVGSPGPVPGMAAHLEHEGLCPASSQPPLLVFFIYFKNIYVFYVFIWQCRVLVAAGGIFLMACGIFSFSMQELLVAA